MDDDNGSSEVEGGEVEDEAAARVDREDSAIVIVTIVALKAPARVTRRLWKFRGQIMC